MLEQQPGNTWLETLTVCTMRRQRCLWLICWIIILSLVDKVVSTRCYQCPLTGGCDDPFDKDVGRRFIKQCDGSCIKYKLKTGVIRQCSYLTLKNKCEGGEYQGKKATVCSCSGDLCNTSSVRTTAVLTPFILSVIVHYLRILWWYNC